jgi:pimeloyl-ACP methyl ester carboxylesterase
VSMITDTESGISIPGTRSRYLEQVGSRDQGQGRLRYLTGGSGAPLVLLHTVRTQAEHFRHLIPLVQQRYTVYALDLPGMGYSEIVPGASYEEPAMRAAVRRLLTQLDLRDVTLLGESMGAVLAVTTAAELPDRVRRVVAVNPYDYAGGIARSSLLARLIVTGVIAPGVGPILARQEPKPVMRSILTGLIAARAGYPKATAPIHLVYGAEDWSRPSDRQANKRLLPEAEFTELPNAGHFIALERPDVLADLLNAGA